MTAGRLIAIPLATRFKVYDQLKVLVFSIFFIAVFLVLLMITNHLNILVYLGSGILGLGLSALFPLLMSVTGSFGFNLTSDITALYIMTASAGEAVEPVFIGLMMRFFGPRIMFYIFLAQSTLMLYLFKIISDFKPKDDEEEEGSSLEMDLIKNWYVVCFWYLK